MRGSDLPPAYKAYKAVFDSVKCKFMYFSRSKEAPGALRFHNMIITPIKMLLLRNMNSDNLKL